MSRLARRFPIQPRNQRDATRRIIYGLIVDHEATGSLTAQAATIAGEATHTSAITHEASGALASQTATIAGTATHLTLHATSGALQAGAATIAGVAVHIGPGAEVESKGAGKSKKPRRRRYQVEVDGEVFDASSAEEAESILEQVKEEAKAAAALAIDRATKAKARPASKVIKDAKKSLELPSISATNLPNIADEVLKDIGDIYQDALRSIEISLLLRKAEQDEEDDEEVLLLL